MRQWPLHSSAASMSSTASSWPTMPRAVSSRMRRTELRVCSQICAGSVVVCMVRWLEWGLGFGRLGFVFADEVAVDVQGGVSARAGLERGEVVEAALKSGGIIAIRARVF